MKLLKQPNRWSCGITSFAMLFDLSIEQAIQLIGHDGSKIIWPEAKEPLCRKGFLIPELVDAAWKLGSGLIQFDAFPMFQSPDCEPVALYTDEEMEFRLDRILAQGSGLIIGRYSPDKCHMVAWDGFDVYDPQDPRIYNFTEVGIAKIAVEHIWIRKEFR